MFPCINNSPSKRGIMNLGRGRTLLSSPTSLASSTIWLVPVSGPTKVLVVDGVGSYCCTGKPLPCCQVAGTMSGGSRIGPCDMVGSRCTLCPTSCRSSSYSSSYSARWHYTDNRRAYCTLCTLCTASESLHDTLNSTYKITCMYLHACVI